MWHVCREGDGQYQQKGGAQRSSRKEHRPTLFHLWEIATRNVGCARDWESPRRARRGERVQKKCKDPPFFLTTKNDPDIPRRMKISAPTRTRRSTRNQAVSINLEKSLTRYALATAGLAAVAMPAAAKADFSGYYAPSHWTLTNTGGSTNGFVDTSGAPASITLHGGSSQSGTAGDTDFTIAAAASGMLNFHWSYFSTDSGTYDSAYFLLNGVPTFLADNGSQGMGDFSIALTSGNIFGFRVHSADNLFGDGELTVSNFNAPVPEGSTLSLLALGALGVVIVMRRRAQAAA
ncbi:MAG: hypothetical protein DMF17_01240 [Verrucomicrobia bacterium]|nr:MAG: hypothetical protein DMF17_01240 [Verrucomicrobiota bacterium]